MAENFPKENFSVWRSKVAVAFEHNHYGRIPSITWVASESNIHPSRVGWDGDT